MTTKLRHTDFLRFGLCETSILSSGKTASEVERMVETFATAFARKLTKERIQAQILVTSELLVDVSKYF